MKSLVSLVLATCALAACSPSENWRETGFDGLSLRMQLPCKPDRTTRQVPLGGQPVALMVTGCESGDAMLAVMSAALPPGTDVQKALLGWQKATLDNMHAGAPQTQPWQRPGMLPMDASRELRVQGQGPDGHAVTAQAVWGAWPENDHARLIHAIVYAPTERPELARNLFDSIRP